MIKALLLLALLSPERHFRARHYKGSAGYTRRPTHLKTHPRQPWSFVCKDGAYSFSAQRRGACSRRGGIAQ